MASLTARERQFDEELDALLDTEVQTPPVLYHYTARSVAMTILRSGIMRATHFACMEDQTELRVPDDVVKALAVRLRGAVNNPAAAVLSRFADDYDDNKAIKICPDIGMTCFTEDGRSRYHWEKYGREGYGVSLGFKVIKERAAANPLFNLMLLPVRYQRGIWEADLEATFVDIAKLLNKRKRTPVEQTLGLVGLFRKAGVISITSKLDEFAPDREWRLVLSGRFGAKPEWIPDQYGDRKVRYVTYAVREGRLPGVHEVVVGRDVSDDEFDAIIAELKEMGYGRDEEMPLVVRAET